MELRPYQIEMVNKSREALSRSKRVMVYGPTGSGKTVTMLDILDKAVIKGKRVLFVVNRKKLVHQFSDGLDMLGIEYGMMQGENVFNVHKGVIAGTVQTISRRGYPDVDMVIIDEAHYAASPQYVDLILHYRDKPILGFSATPFTKGLGATNDRLGGEKLFQDLVKTISIKELVDCGFLCDLEIYCPSEPDLSGVKMVTNSFGEKDYNQGQAAKAMMNTVIVSDIIKNWKKLGNNEQTILFAANVAHSKMMCEEFNKAGIKADHVDGRMDDKDVARVCSDFSLAKIKIICSIEVLREGVDFPNAVVGIWAKPHKSPTTIIQKAGRLLRQFPGKDIARIIDHTGTFTNYGYPTRDIEIKLHDGNRDESPVTEKVERIKEDVICSNCGILKKTLACQSCGHTPKVNPKVKVVDGEIVRMVDDSIEESSEPGKKKVNKREFLSKDANLLYSELLHIAGSRGWLNNKVYKVFADITGRPPRESDKGGHPVSPRVDTVNMVTSINMKNQARRKKGWSKW